MSRYRVLLLAEMANPEWVSVPLEGWSHSSAIRELVDAHVVTQIRNAPAFQRAGWSDGTDFTAIDSELFAKPIDWLGTVLRGGAGTGWTTVAAVNMPAYYYFEHLVWKQFGAQIRSKEFDLVHRLTPLSPTYPSIIAKHCRDAGVPFLLGPLNGGLPWPKEFDRVRRREREWLSYVRDAYKLAPGYAATWENANAIIVGSIDTWKQMPAAHRDKCVYIPENAIDPARFPTPAERSPASLPVRIVFIGRLVPYKGADMLIEAAEPFLKNGTILLDILGDGPEMPVLRTLVDRLDLKRGVNLAGWVEHTAIHDYLSQSDCFGFPSIREFGGAVVLEAMAMGIPAIVVDYGGPGELATEKTGYKIPLGSREAIIASLRATLEHIVSRPDELRDKGRLARERVMTHFTWHAKAMQVHDVYDWVLKNRNDKPNLGMPIPDLSIANSI